MIYTKCWCGMIHLVLEGDGSEWRESVVILGAAVGSGRGYERHAVPCIPAM